MPRSCFTSYSIIPVQLPSLQMRNSLILPAHGMSEPQLNALNSNEDISSSQKSEGDTEHGLGLKIARQIVKAHQGTIRFSDTVPHGLSVTIELPIE